MDPRELRTAGRLVWAVSLGSFVAQLAVTSLSRAWAWDEAIYLSQVTRHTQALPFVASRARGITLLIAPLTWSGTPGWAIRLVLAVASSALLGLVFRAWVPRVGYAAPVGAFLFAMSWPALLYGSEVMPNLWAALLGVGVVGFLARDSTVDGAGRRNRMGLAVCAGSMALMRPPDALVLALALTLAVIVFSRDTWRSLIYLSIGVAVGWMPWLIEMSVRFGGPLSALRSAREVSHLAGSATGVMSHLALTDGPLLGPDRGGGIPVVGVIWWGALLGLVLVALVLERRGEESLSVRMAVIGGVALALEYLVLVSGLAPRFLLPSLALLSLGAGCGLNALRRSAVFGRAATGVVVSIIVAWTMWQVGTLRRIETRAAAERAVPTAVGGAIQRELMDQDGPCVVASSDAYPQVAFAAGCGGYQLGPMGDDALRRSPTVADEALVFVTRSPIAIDQTSLELEPLGEPAAGWFAYRVLSSAALGSVGAT
ncbi:MAG TPA: hypothetical protein VI341_03215 [Actinomycetota bacterium]